MTTTEGRLYASLPRELVVLVLQHVGEQGPRCENSYIQMLYFMERQIFHTYEIIVPRSYWGITSMCCPYECIRKLPHNS